MVLLHGARQTGKSTLVQSLAAAAEHPIRYVTLDDARTLAAVKSDPAGFLSGLSGPVALDEIQHAPELLLPIKAEVDRNRRPGRYILTGSANVLMLPKLSESLAGRMEILTLWPLSQGEIEGGQENFVDVMFSKTFAAPQKLPLPGGRLRERVLRGGYPEMIAARPSAERRRAWFNSYLTTILQRDVREVSDIDGLSEMPNLLMLLATRMGSLLNLSEVSREAGISHTTLKRYMSLLQAIFMVQLLPPWFRNIGKRLVKAPKLYLNDTGLAANLLGIDSEATGFTSSLAGGFVENFAVMELRKQITWSRVQPRMYHFRTLTGQIEVDIVLEGAGERIVGVEVKEGGSLSSKDFMGLRMLAQSAGDRFVRGVLLYGGEDVIPFGHDLYAIPHSALWQI